MELTMEREREQAPNKRQPGPFERVKVARKRLQPVFHGVAFWGAILLPWVVIGLLFTGFAVDEPELFTGVVTLNLVSAVVGGKYEHTL